MPELLDLGISIIDIRQAALGKGISVYSSHKAVLNSDDTKLKVGDSIKEIMRIYSEIYDQGFEDWDAETHFASLWFSQHGWDELPYYEFEKMLRSSRANESKMVTDGIAKSSRGYFQLLPNAGVIGELTDFGTYSVWKYLHILIEHLESGGEISASTAYKLIIEAKGADFARSSIKSLAVYMFNNSEQMKQVNDSIRYNSLLIAWPEIERLATSQASESSVQTSLI